MATFNLIDEPWLPCVMLDGRRREVSLKEALLDSHNVRELFDESPLVTVALHRLLLAILHRNFGPQTLRGWAELWEAQAWDAQTLMRYFGDHHDRFDLFGSERPFYQVGEIEDAPKQPVTILAQELSRGNNATLFDHSFEASTVSLEPSRAACALVAVQSFAIGFGKSKPFYLSDSPLIRGMTILVSGDSLFQTLTLNLLPYNEDRPIPSKADDAPVWEQDKRANPRREGTMAVGYLDYLTWQSRRIHLYPEGIPPTVSHCQLQQNLKLAEGILDPFKCFVKSKELGFRPLGLRQDKALWRDSYALFQQVDDSSKRPAIFNHLAQIQALRISGQIRGRQAYSFSAFGLATDEGKAASVTMWRHERLPLPLEYLDNKALLNRLKDALEVCEAAGTDLRMSIRELSRYLLAPNCDQSGAASANPDEVKSLARSFAAERRFWPKLEAPFKTLLLDLVGDVSTDSDGDTVYGARKSLDGVKPCVWLLATLLKRLPAVSTPPPEVSKPRHSLAHIFIASLAGRYL